MRQSNAEAQAILDYIRSGAYPQWVSNELERRVTSYSKNLNVPTDCGRGTMLSGSYSNGYGNSLY